jgi:hypothetical protein
MPMAPVLRSDLPKCIETLGFLIIVLSFAERSLERNNQTDLRIMSMAIAKLLEHSILNWSDEKMESSKVDLDIL